MESLKIICMSVTAAIIYGIVLDQITARICVEYFTIGHPPIFGTDDPTLLGLGWGIVATWWAGLLVGIPLAIAARGGSRPKRSSASLIRPIIKLLIGMAICAGTTGILGWFLARQGAVFLTGPIADEVPVDRHVAILADLWVHLASYACGFLGGILLFVTVWRSRRLAMVEFIDHF